MLTRRALFGMLALAALGPERLLWRPGKLILIPKPGWAVVVKPGESLISPTQAAINELRALLDTWNYDKFVLPPLGSDSVGPPMTCRQLLEVVTARERRLSQHQFIDSSSMTTVRPKRIQTGR